MVRSQDIRSGRSLRSGRGIELKSQISHFRIQILTHASQAKHTNGASASGGQAKTEPDRRDADKDTPENVRQCDANLSATHKNQ